jgi:hypothetical protein
MTQVNGEISRTSDWDGENSQIRIVINLEQIYRNHPETNLSELLEYWRERSSIEGGIPSVENFQAPYKTLPWVDVSPANPMYFSMNNHPAGLCGNWNATRFAEYPIAIHAVSCAFEYYDCKVRREAAYIQIRQKIFGVDREYAKLMVPVADKNGKVTRAYYAWRHLRFPVIEGASAEL